MSDTGENYTTFNSRTLVEIVGDVTDEALKATKSSSYSAFLLADFSTGLDANPCSHSTLESSAVQSRWRLQQLQDSMVTGSEFYSVPALVNQMYCLSMARFPRNSRTQSFDCGSKCQNQNTASQWVNVLFRAGRITNHTTF